MRPQPGKIGVFLLWGNDQGRRTLFKILRATGSDVVFCEDFPGPDHDWTSYRLVVLDFEGRKRESLDLLARLEREPKRPSVLVLTDTRESGDLVELFSHRAMTNLLAKNMELRADELVITVQKILHNDIFGLEKYLTWGCEPRSIVVNQSKQKNEILQTLDAYLTDIGCNKRLITLAKGVGDEFIMNAVYNAPVDAHGIAKYAARARTEAVQLAPNEAATFSFACDGRRLALSVSDPFGRLSQDTVIDYLHKCFRGQDDQIDKKDGGAGLGLYAVFESLNQFVVNVRPNQCTEMIGIIDISGTYKDFAHKPKSLDMFVERD